MEIARTEGVARVQAELGVDHLWSDFDGDRSFDRFTENEKTFISSRDSFYMATVSETGWPYVQHRGGPQGFLKIIDDTKLAFADYSGNRQYLSLGNLSTDSRVSMILMDYPRRARMKLFGHIEVVGLDSPLLDQVTDDARGAKPQRIMVFSLDAFDWNCPKFITPRFTQSEIQEAVQPLQERLEALEAENARLRSGNG